LTTISIRYDCYFLFFLSYFIWIVSSLKFRFFFVCLFF
jgi:hypothetical protein